MILKTILPGSYALCMSYDILFSMKYRPSVCFSFCFKEQKRIRFLPYNVCFVYFPFMFSVLSVDIHVFHVRMHLSGNFSLLEFNFQIVYRGNTVFSTHEVTVSHAFSERVKNSHEETYGSCPLAHHGPVFSVFRLC